MESNPAEKRHSVKNNQRTKKAGEEGVDLEILDIITFLMTKATIIKHSNVNQLSFRVKQISFIYLYFSDTTVHKFTCLYKLN